MMQKNRAMSDAAKARWVRLPVNEHGILQTAPSLPSSIISKQVNDGRTVEAIESLPYLYLDWLQLADQMHEVAHAAARLLHRPLPSLTLPSPSSTSSYDTRNLWLPTYRGPASSGSPERS
jgi:hypothetical protein